MSEHTYWRLVLLVMLAMKMVFLHQFADLSPTLKLLDFNLATVIVTSLLIAYQRQIWAVGKEEERRKRVNYLVRKAKLSKAQIKAVSPLLIGSAKKSERIPWIWKLMRSALALFWAVTLDTYADAIVDSLSPYIKFGNILPPPF